MKEEMSINFLLWCIFLFTILAGLCSGLDSGLDLIENANCFNSNGGGEYNTSKDGWYCPVASTTPAYLGCRHHLSAIFCSTPNVSCSGPDFKYNIDINGLSVGDIDIHKLNGSNDCCQIFFSLASVEKVNNTVVLLAAEQPNPPLIYYCTCEYLLEIKSLSVENISAEVSCHHVNISWTPPDIPDGDIVTGYNVSMDGHGVNITGLTVNETYAVLNINDTGLEANSSYNVTVEPLYCGGVGNSSSAIITITMKPQVSENMRYSFVDINSSHVSLELQSYAQMECIASYPNYVSVVLDCESSPYLNKTLPVCTGQDCIILLSLVLPINQTCTGVLNWGNKSPETLIHSIVLRTADLYASGVVQSSLNVDRWELKSRCVFSCCGVVEKSESSHLICPNDASSLPQPTNNSITAWFGCNDHFSTTCFSFKIENLSQPVLPSSTTAGSMTTSTSCPMSNTCSSCSSSQSVSPSPTSDAKKGCSCADKCAVVGVVTFFVIAVIITVSIIIIFLVKRYANRIKTYIENHLIHQAHGTQPTENLQQGDTSVTDDSLPATRYVEAHPYSYDTPPRQPHAPNDPQTSEISVSYRDGNTINSSVASDTKLIKK